MLPFATIGKFRHKLLGALGAMGSHKCGGGVSAPLSCECVWKDWARVRGHVFLHRVLLWHRVWSRIAAKNKRNSFLCNGFGLVGKCF